MLEFSLYAISMSHSGYFKAQSMKKRLKIEQFDKE